MGTANERHIAGKCVCCACTDRRQAGDQLDYINTVARRCHTCRPSYHPRPLSAVAYTRRAARPPSGTHYALDARRLLPTTTSPSRRAHVDNRRVNYDAWHRRACTVRRVPFRWRARVPGGRCRMLPTENVFREVLRCTHLDLDFFYKNKFLISIRLRLRRRWKCGETCVTNILLKKCKCNSNTK